SAPSSEEELAATIAQHQGPVRVVGSGHSFTPLAVTDSVLLTLDGMSGLISHDANARRAIFYAGTRLGELGSALAGVGQDMPNLPDINKQSLGGAIATGTHGTGRACKALHGEIVSLRLITARGEIIDCSAAQGSEVFNACRVGLGAFGVVTRIQLQNRPLTRVVKRTYVSQTQEAIEQWPELIQRHRNAEFYAVPFTGLASVITCDETNRPVQPRGPDRDAEGLKALKRLRDLFGFSSGLRRRIARLAMSDLPAEEAVDEGWKLLSNERPIRFNEIEFHFALDAQIPALRETLAAIETQRRDVFFPVEVRVVDADDAWLSPFYGRVSGSIAVHAYYKDDYRFFFELIEPIFRKYGGRPHWGKLHTFTAADLAALYPRWKEAMQVRRELDPDGRLLNDYLKAVLS
ncbi:MAG TPA: D-arabinono-1,4-lactone oxidase, partial [Steroidobacter sp.]|nr:D-arabinono-1,4-lactone oxidase [Steroidobacter sp.]